MPNSFYLASIHALLSTYNMQVISSFSFTHKHYALYYKYRYSLNSMGVRYGKYAYKIRYALTG